MTEPWRLLAVDYGERLLAALFIAVAGWLALRLLLSPMRRLLARSRIDPATASFLLSSTRTVLVVVIVVGVVGQLGVQTASLLAVLGAAGLAVALSLQGVLANFAAGLLVLGFRLVRVGDLIELGDVKGRVVELLPFHIVLVALDNQRLTVPNTMLMSGALRNHSALPTRMSQWTLALKPDDDLAAARAALLARLGADGRVLPAPAPEAVVTSWALDQRIMTVQAWTTTADQLAVQRELLEGLGEAVATTRRPASP